MAGCSGELKRAALAGIAAVFLAVACSGSGVTRQPGERAEGGPAEEPAVSRLPVSLDLEALSDGAPTTTVAEPTVTSPSITVTPSIVPSTTVPATTAPPVAVEESAEDVEIVDNQDGTYRAPGLPDFVPRPPSWAANTVQVDPSDSCKATEELEIPEYWHAPPTLAQLRAEHSEAEAKALATAISDLTSSFEAFLAADLPTIELRQVGRYSRTTAALPGQHSLPLEELGEQGFCNTGVAREIAISDLAAAIADSYATGLLQFEFSPFTSDGIFANPFLTYAYFVETDPLHDWTVLMEYRARFADRRSGLSRLSNWRSLVIKKACHDRLGLTNSEFLEEIYTKAMNMWDAIPTISDSASDELRRLGYSHAEFSSYIDECRHENNLGHIPPPVDFGALNRLLADSVYDVLVEEFDTLVHAAPAGLTLIKGDGVEQHDVGHRCLATPDLSPVEYPSSLDPDYNWSLQNLVNPVTYGVQVLDQFPAWVEDYYASSEAILMLEMPKINFRSADLYHGSGSYEREFDFHDRSRLLGDLASAGYCNEGVSRQLSVSDVAFGLAFGLVSVEYGNPFVSTPHIYNSASLFYAEYAEADPFHEFVTQLKAHISSFARAMPEWQYFKWPQATAIRYCMSELKVNDDALTLAYLDWLFDDSLTEVLLTRRDLEAVARAGYSITEFETRLARCYRTFASNDVRFPENRDLVVAYFSSRFEPMMREWIASNADLIPSNLVIVE